LRLRCSTGQRWKFVRRKIKLLAQILKSYRCAQTTGDRYAAEWVVQAFRRCGITYRHSERDRSSIYLDGLPLLTTGRCRLVDSKRLVAQLACLERRTSALGKDRVDHGPGGHDDVANAAMGALTLAASRPAPLKISADVLSRAKARGRARRRRGVERRVSR
jgi:hypothetical protein